MYLADDIPWVIGYSGGKDSTATLQLVWLAIQALPPKDRKKTIHIINTDTLVESPVVARWAQESLEKMRQAAEEQKIPFVPHRLTPDYDNTFWVNFLGKGYPFPRKKFRWCTDRLKIQPVNKFVKEKIAEHGEIIMVLGTRKAESANRARTMAFYEKKRVRELLSPNPTCNIRILGDIQTRSYLLFIEELLQIMSVHLWLRRIFQAAARADSAVGFAQW